MSNYIDEPNADGYFGGAFVVNAEGETLAALSLNQEGLLFYEYKDKKRNLDY